jgi:chromosome segregation ATPase
MSELPGVDTADRDALDDQEPKKRRNPWIWVSVVLGLVAVGLLVWALTTKSDLDNAEQEADAAQAQVEQGKKTGGAVLVGGKAAYDDVTQELGARTDDLAATEKDLQKAQKNADQAEQNAKAAEQDAAQADNEADKAKAETDKAQAETEAAESKAAITADCAKAYVSALGMLFEGESVKAQAQAVKQQLKSISATCKASLEGA